MELHIMGDSELRYWYDTELAQAFPPNERKPLAGIQGLIADGCYDVLGLYDGKKLVGYATIMKSPQADYVLLDYLGVTETQRNGGVGAELLRRIGTQYAGRPGVITEAELPIPGENEEENELRHRRICFYRRCGFVPVYEMGTCGTRFQALLLGPAPVGMDKLMGDHRAVYGPLRTDVKVPLGPGEKPELPYWMK